jgi:hypothetical protein
MLRAGVRDATSSDGHAYLQLWLGTPQGTAYTEASAAILSAVASTGIRSGGDPVEDFANVCAFWFLGRTVAQTIAPLKSFADQWLTK